MFEPSDDSSEDGGFAKKGSKNPQVYSKKPTLLMAESDDEEDDFVPATKPTLVQKQNVPQAKPNTFDDSDDSPVVVKKPAEKKQGGFLDDEESDEAPPTIAKKGQP